jgi:hypothetical protein
MIKYYCDVCKHNELADPDTRDMLFEHTFSGAGDVFTIRIAPFKRASFGEVLICQDCMRTALGELIDRIDWGDGHTRCFDSTE